MEPSIELLQRHEQKLLIFKSAISCFRKCLVKIPLSVSTNKIQWKCKYAPCMLKWLWTWYTSVWCHDSTKYLRQNAVT